MRILFINSIQGIEYLSKSTPQNSQGYVGNEIYEKSEGGVDGLLFLAGFYMLCSSSFFFHRFFFIGVVVYRTVLLAALLLLLFYKGDGIDTRKRLR